MENDIKKNSIIYNNKTEKMELKFKTNINCGGCIASVKPHLDKTNEIVEWSVDTANPNKILSVQTTILDAQQVIEIIQKAGFKAESI